MDNVFVSKGCVSCPGEYKIGRRRKRDVDVPLDEPWYYAYKQTWSTIETAAEKINNQMFKQILSDLDAYIRNMKNDIEVNYLNEIQTAILLTGVNLPDHEFLFRQLTDKLSGITSHIAVAQSRDFSNIKNLTEETIFQLINDSDLEYQPEFKKNQCNFRVLQSWYQENCNPNTPLIIIIPDFESFDSAVLRDFILILSSYSRTMKFVLIFGVATSLHVVHRSLPYDVTSKLRVQVFHTQTQIKSLSDILEGTVLSSKTPFMLTGRAFQLLTDIFLFYDFSAHGFLQGYKLCMIQHFHGNNISSLCCKLEEIDERFDELTEDDIKELKKLPSIIKYMDKSRKKIDDIKKSEFKKIIIELLKKFHSTMNRFFIVLKCLHSLTFLLPHSPLGKQLREIYGNAVTCDIVDMQEYKKCLQLLDFLSKDELLSKLRDVLEILKTKNEETLKDLTMNMEKHIEVLEQASLEVSCEPLETVDINPKNRFQLKENLLKNLQKQSRSPFKQAQIDFLEYLNHDVFVVHLVNPNRLPASEIFCFSDAYVTKHHLRGSLRAAIHTGLNNPQVYLKCGCCKLENDEAIQPTLPDLSIIYKLHLESRKLINMYDWLQAFLTIVNPNDQTDEQREIDPKSQARFTRAIAELQFLGFIKSSRKKTDHVKRLT